MFICRAGDVAPSSTFPSRADYIRAPVWPYKTSRLKEGGSEAERDAERRTTVAMMKPRLPALYRSGQASVNVFYCENRVIFGFICMGFGNIGGHVQFVKIRLL